MARTLIVRWTTRRASGYTLNMVHKKLTPLATIGEGKIILNHRVISYQVKRSTRARRVRLEIKPESGLTIVIPGFFGIARVPDVLKEKRDWILGNFAGYDKVRSRSAGGTEVEAGDAVFYRGRKLTVLTEESKGKTDCVRLEPDRLIVSTVSGGRELNVILEQWYRIQAAALIGQKVEEWSAKLSVSHNGVTIRGQKTRWGSCSRQGSLSFNWKLLMAPEPVIDYVVIHELAHLREMNHSTSFWRLVAEHCSGWRELRKWLKTHEVELTAGLLASRF